MSDDKLSSPWPSASSSSPRASAPRMRPLPLSSAKPAESSDRPEIDESDQTLLDPSTPTPRTAYAPASRPLAASRDLPSSSASSSPFSRPSSGYDRLLTSPPPAPTASSHSTFPPFLLFLILLLATAFLYTTFFQTDSLTKNPAPPVEVTSVVDGSEQKTPLQGKLTVLSFWATWCPACVHTLSGATDRAAELQKQGVQYLLINVDQGADPAQIRSFLQNKGISGSLLSSHVLGLSTASRYKISVLPTSIVVGPSGKILHAQAGHIPASLLQDFIRTHLGKTASLVGRPHLPTPRHAERATSLLPQGT